jgi:hypothetical protein
MGIILIFMVAVAIGCCCLSTAVAGGLVLLSLHLVRNSNPAWRWPGVALLVSYAGVMFFRYWTAKRSDQHVPEGLRELWAQVETVTNLWPLPSALIAGSGAVVVLLFR